MITKKCNNCNKELDILLYSKNKTTKDKYSNKCKACTSKIRKQKYIKKSRIKYDIDRKEKECKCCKKILSIKNFGKNKNIADGHENKCKLCRKLARKNKSVNINIKEKSCYKCKNIKSIIFFSKDSSRDDGYNSICKDCKKNYNLKYKKLKYVKEKNKIKFKKWILRNPSYRSLYYKKNKEKIKKRESKYRETAKGKWSLFKANAKYYKKKYNITFKEYKKIINSCCSYCGCKENIGLDRIDSEIDYLKNNINPCCSNCNYMKNNLTLKQFKEHVLKIIYFQQFGISEISSPIINLSGNNRKDRYYTIRGRFFYYKRMAKKRNIKFNLSIEEFKKYWQKPCSYCGSTINTIGLDRMNNNIGYIDFNICSCCFICNSMKRDLSIESFFIHCIKIINFEKTYE